MPDPYGKPVGPHFAVVLNTDEELKTGCDLDVAVISSSIPGGVIQDGWFELPCTLGKPGGHEKTGLSVRSVVKGTWVVEIPRAEITCEGDAPLHTVAKLVDWINSGIEDMEDVANPDGD